MKVISYCLWGNNPKYIDGLYRNVCIIKEKLPGYRVYLYVNKNYYIDIDGFTVIRTNHDGNYLMFDRFRPVGDITYSRDLDSPILDREIEAMKEFEASDKGIHVMRDHPYHRARILGGTLGIKKGAVRGINKLIDNHIYKYNDEWFSDQIFLNDIIYPMVKDNMLIHSSINFYTDEKPTPFPTERVGDEFVGMILPRVYEHHAVLRNAENII
jgi:hypothetical protein